MKLLKYFFYILLILVLVVTFTPLSVYYSQIKNEIKPLKLEGIKGSVIKGSSNNAKYLGIDLGKANWFIYPSSYNAMTMELSLQNEDYDFTGNYVKSSSHESLQKVKGSMDWSILKKAIQFNKGQISGYINFDFDHIEFKDRIPQRIEGKLFSKELKLLKPINKDLGTIEVVFKPTYQPVIVGEVNSQSSVINISGAIYIHKNHRWEIKLTLLPYPGEYEIEYILQNIGDKRSGGGRSLNLSGYY